MRCSRRSEAWRTIRICTVTKSESYDGETESHDGDARIDAIPVTRGSGNVFADLGLPNPEEQLAKAQLASRINEVIRRRKLTQQQAAELMEIDQPKVSLLRNGRLSGFSTQRLIDFLHALGQDVEIVVRAAPRSRKRGRLHLAA
jgi:predicted XRE-type DNA-binding protein